ncbi:MAG: integrin alpha [Planctomycetaceae bacterium]
MDGVAALDQSGWSVSDVGDVNGDGFNDVVIGAFGADPGDKNAAGSSYVVFGGNFTGGAETQVGTDGGDTLTAVQGAGAVDILIGGRGGDVLISDGGPDVLRGGQGDDVLAIPDVDFSSTRRLLGGNGIDTLRLDGSGLTLDLTAIPDNRIVDIEEIDITGSGANILTLNRLEVLNISSHSNTLLVRRDGDDIVNIGTGWTQQADEIIGPETFNVYTQGAATLKVQAVAVPATIAGRHIFYNNSAYDFDSDPLTAPFGTGSAAADANDDFAIATDKSALQAGSKATFANYTSFSNGINGIMVDIADLAGTPTVSDFQFRIGNDNNPTGWSAAPAPTSITVRSGAGAGGSDRVTLIWPNNVIQKTWLQITVLATPNTGLASDDVFYFGNAIGETGDAPTANAFVNAVDRTRILNNPKTFLNRATVTDLHDINRDSLVNAIDRTIALNNGTTFLTDLNLIDLTGGGGGGAAAVGQPEAGTGIPGSSGIADSGQVSLVPMQSATVVPSASRQPTDIATLFSAVSGTAVDAVRDSIGPADTGPAIQLPLMSRGPSRSSSARRPAPARLETASVPAPVAEDRFPDFVGDVLDSLFGAEDERERLLGELLFLI